MAVSPTEVKTLLNQTIVRVLEEWAMMLLDAPPNPTDAFTAGGPCYVATVTYKGPISGTYSIICQESFARALTSNLLGSDDVLTPEIAADALKEMANVLGGNLLTDSYGDQLIFDIMPPQFQQVSSVHELSKILATPYTFYYQADGNPIAVTATMTGA